VAATLPTGITADPLTIAAGATSGDLTLHASSSVTPVITSAALTGIGARVYNGSLGIVVGVAHGTPDPTFAGGGLLIIPISPNSLINDVSVDDNDDIYLAGMAQSGEVARVTSSGTVDTSFGIDGVVDIDPVTLQHASSAITTITSSSDVFVLGQDFPPNTGGTAQPKVAVWKLDQAGTLDTSFGTSGEAIGDLGWVMVGAKLTGSSIQIPYSDLTTKIGVETFVQGQPRPTLTTSATMPNFIAAGAALDGAGGAYFAGCMASAAVMVHVAASGGLDPSFATAGIFTDTASVSGPCYMTLGLTGGREVTLGYATNALLATTLDASGTLVADDVLSLNGLVWPGGVDASGLLFVFTPISTTTPATGELVGRVTPDAALDTTYGVAGFADALAMAGLSMDGQTPTVTVDHQGRAIFAMALPPDDHQWLVMRLLP
jgi:hypothetical protein